MKHLLLAVFILFCLKASAQSGSILGTVKNTRGPLGFATAKLLNQPFASSSDTAGLFVIRNIPAGKYELQVSAVGHLRRRMAVSVFPDSTTEIGVILKEDPNSLNEVVVTGTMKEVSRLASPVPVEVFSPAFFKKNPAPSLFESVGMINGVQPQLNCNVCNTGDIHINGMEGPYTMVLIDGMPIVSSLSTVYGLNGIPNSIVERIEVVKGPASSLYGSEAMGGIINVITKDPTKAPLLSLDAFGTSWRELNTDAAFTFGNDKYRSLLGVNYFNYSNPLDKNKDNFTDLTQQKRVSVFNKWSLARKENKVASFAARYVYEDRWGGEMSWNKSYRGTEQMYGESIYTKRWEFLGMYQLPLKERIMFQFSFNTHNQNSYYGNTPYMAEQNVAFTQLYWDKQLGKKHNFLLGGTYRYTFYDDNTPGTASSDATNQVNQPSKTPLPGLFVQDEWSFHPKQTLLMGYRYDYDKHHGHIHSPRIAYKWAPDHDNTLRASFGTGFRVVNLFTEDHAALSGAREVVITEALNPERSYNGNLNYVWRKAMGNLFLGLDATAFYSHFSNKIVGDFDSDPRKIIYDNLRGYAISRGISLNTDFSFTFPLKILAGATYQEVYQMEDDAAGRQIKTRQLFAPRWSGNLVASYTFPRSFSVDLTADWNGPMRLPVFQNDYRPEYSPAFVLANIQLTKKLNNGVEIYGGLKNLLNFIPKDPIMRPFDPFDRMADDPVSNPYGYTFDPSYNFAPLQGIRGFAGIRYNLFADKTKI